MTRRHDGCARVPSLQGAGAPAAPLPVASADPVLCLGCGNVFGRGAEAGTVCPYCSGPLRPLPGARESLEGGVFLPAEPGTGDAA
jgi:hypothetical protein